MKLLYFAWLRAKIGMAEERVELPAGVTTVAALLDWLRARGPGFADALADPRIVRVAVNQRLCRQRPSGDGGRRGGAVPAGDRGLSR